MSKKESSHDMQAWEKGKAPGKIFTIENKKQDKNFNGTCLGLAFLPRVGRCGACIPLLCFFAVWSRIRQGGSAAICPASAWPKYIMPVIGSRNTKINTAENRLAYNLHYVNIALGIYFWCAFLYPEGTAQLLPVLFLPLKINPHKNKSRHPASTGQVVLQKGWTKSMTGKLKLWHLEKQRIEKYAA
jgi:hypothetical protein